MRRVQIVTGDFRLGGGMDRANLALADHLASEGVSVRLVAHFVDEALASRPGVSVRHVGRPLGSHLLGAPLLNRAGRDEARRCLHDGGRVVVNGGNCLVADVNWAHYVHAAHEPSMGTSAGPRRLIHSIARRRAIVHEKTALRSARLVIANSERTRVDLIERVNIDPARIAVIYYGIDANRFGAISPEEKADARRSLGWVDGRPTMAFIGALGDRRKGFDTLFEAMRRLCLGEPSWEADLVVVGSGAEAPEWERRACESGLGGRVRFLGRRDDVPRILAACDALVHPARYEAYGLGVHEALCRGLPALVSASAGVAERYPDDLRPLLITNPNDPDELASRLMAWLATRDTLRGPVTSLAEKLRARTWDDMAREIRVRIEASPLDGKAAR